MFDTANGTYHKLIRYDKRENKNYLQISALTLSIPIQQRFKANIKKIKFKQNKKSFCLSSQSSCHTKLFKILPQFSSVALKNFMMYERMNLLQNKKYHNKSKGNCGAYVVSALREFPAADFPF
ncbi:CLUMA_CG009484, isoform A [Clunio marinus]|uniref:CLUMA_CG009484, isoform A n=1 Tax=Clunio marinus TaxID=568069 RepID=A0A1J1I6W7_9DIPT|nr:CLUMA_CG009484, isoform A [Clunio marinus]